MANKKNFKQHISNPAMQFISTPLESPKESIKKSEIKTTGQKLSKETITKEKPHGYKIDHRYVETRSKRMQILITPSLNEKLKSRAAAEGRSVNDLINILLENKLK